MKKEFSHKKVGVTVLCRISAKGGAGIYLYIPRNFAEVYGVHLAEFAEIEFKKVFKRKYHPEKKKNPLDLRSRKQPKADDF